jgi:hypothetical protein
LLSIAPCISLDASLSGPKANPEKIAEEISFRATNRKVQRERTLFSRKRTAPALLLAQKSPHLRIFGEMIARVFLHEHALTRRHCARCNSDSGEAEFLFRDISTPAAARGWRPPRLLVSKRQSAAVGLR